jgi:hypothetical protein
MRSVLHMVSWVPKAIASAAVLAMLGFGATVALAAASPTMPAAAPRAPLYTQLALKNGWTNYGFGTRKAAVFKDSSGVVHFKGAISTKGASINPFTLPKAFWPGGTVNVAADMCDVTNGRLVISNTGVATVEAQNGNFSNAACFTSLEGISYTP